MNSFTVYLIESGICLFMFYLIFILLLKKETFFRANRFYLLITSVISMIIPLIKLHITHSPASRTYMVFLNEIAITAERSTETANYIAGNAVLPIIYITGFSWLLFRFITGLLRITRLKKISEPEKHENCTIWHTGRNISAFSFFRNIFINRDLKNSNKVDEMIAHEKIHIRQYHSVDITLIEIITIIQWFNPVVYLYKKSIKEIHEYLTDGKVIAQGFSLIKYQKLLLQQAIGEQFYLVNNFNKSLTLKRLIMMKKKSKRIAQIKMLAVIPIFTTAVILFSFSDDEAAASNVVLSDTREESTVETTTDNTIDGEEVFMIVEEMPEFPGGETALRKYIAKNVEYPVEAKEEGISGKVFIRFAVLKTGKVGHVTIARGDYKYIDEEAVRVIKSMPDWKPGKQRGQAVNVWYTMPINFKF